MHNSSNVLHPTVTCKTGTYIGVYEKENQVCAFKGIPYAQPITPKLRWRAPLPLPPSDKIIYADHFGKACTQRSILPYKMTSENCLTLNIWTKDIHRKNKAVLFYIPGGSYSIGGSLVPEYNGMYLADEFEDIVVVTCNYRLNLFGFIDFSNVPGGEGFSTSCFNGVLDCQMALFFVKENIEAFGGNPDNVTIFGESAGGGMVNLLMTSPTSKGLFRRVIAQSGSVELSFTQKQFDDNHQTEELLRITKCKNMYELSRLSTEQFYYAMGMPTRYIGVENGRNLCDLNNFPLVGGNSILPAKPFEAMCHSPARDYDLMIGTVADELRMWVTTYTQSSMSEKFAQYYDFINYQLELRKKKMSPEKIHNYNLALKITRNEFDDIAMKCPGIWRLTEVANELTFRCPAIKVAQNHINTQSRTYMYLFSKHSTLYKWQRSCHACEIPYVFYHLKHNTFCGDVDAELALKMASAWVCFAKTGNPSNGYASWDEYDLIKRNTMCIENDNTMHMVSDPRRDMRILLI